MLGMYQKEGLGRERATAERRRADKRWAGLTKLVYNKNISYTCLRTDFLAMTPSLCSSCTRVNIGA